jgi:transcription elongation GreA/GreB family factor
MSRAFVRESDQDGSEALPPRAISAHPNLVTPGGLKQLEARLHALEEERAAARAAGDAAAVARIQRDAQYFAQRVATARVVEPAADPGVVRFGVRVVLQCADGAERAFRLVGEDEADPASGLLSWVSPLAQALLGRSPGDASTVWSLELSQIVILLPPFTLNGLLTLAPGTTTSLQGTITNQGTIQVNGSPDDRVQQRECSQRQSQRHG